ncbi:MAG: ABC transporter ATP-binding protein [Pseudomonadota bacterium]
MSTQSDGSVPVLAMSGVRRTFDEGGGRALDVLNGVDLTLHRGELCALVGQSGAGKSTLLHIAGLLERPTEGEVVIQGHATSHLGDPARTRLRRHEIGFVYQFHHLLPEFSAQENLLIPQFLAGTPPHIARDRANDLLDFLGLTARADHRPAELSGGEQQRVAIARAVVNAPKLLLADEPTGNLDPRTAETVFSMLESLVRASGLAALIASHNHELAARMDRRLSIADGQLSEAALS